MDVWRELFGGGSSHDEEFEGHLSKNLFGRQDQEIEKIDSQQMDQSESDREGRSELLGTLPGLSLSPTTGTDISSVPEQMPIYLLEDDEGNEEEIIRLITPQTSTEVTTDPPSQTKASLSLQLPWCNSSIGVNVTPIQVLPKAAVVPPPRKHHKGGWPKGKSRKVSSGVALPPKPPASGYGLFLSEHMAEQKLKSSSMSQVSKAMGKQWSALSEVDKAVYHKRSNLARQHYLTQLRRYLHSTSSVPIEDVEKVLSQSLSTENNDSLLLCDLCKLTFNSLHNKRCHYSGRLHAQTLVEVLCPQSGKTEENLPSTMASEAIKFNVCLSQVKEAMAMYNSTLQTNASLAQTAAEQELIYNEAEAVLISLQEKWDILSFQLTTLMSSCVV